MRLNSLHNIAFFQTWMSRLRRAIREDRPIDWSFPEDNGEETHGD